MAISYFLAMDSGLIQSAASEYTGTIVSAEFDDDTSYIISKSVKKSVDLHKQEEDKNKTDAVMIQQKTNKPVAGKSDKKNRASTKSNSINTTFFVRKKRHNNKEQHFLTKGKKLKEEDDDDEKIKTNVNYGLGILIISMRQREQLNNKI